MKYLSLFSGIGGFEYALQQICPRAKCIGYSEIKPAAIEVYKSHFPSHTELGDITQIPDKKLKSLKYDLLVAGFPCTNLSSAARIRGDGSGLKGKQSSLFYEVLRVIRLTKPKKIILENNASMSKENRETITKELEKFYKTIYLTKLDNADFGVQVRKRLFWTNFPINVDSIKCTQTWEDILEPVEKVQELCRSEKFIVNTLNNVIVKQKKNSDVIQAESVGDNQWKFDITKGDKKSRFQMTMHSDIGTEKELPYSSYPVGKSRPLCAGIGGGFSCGIVIDRRGDKGFFIRNFSTVEKCRLFGYPDDYVKVLKSKQMQTNVLGNTVSILMVKHVLQSLF